VFPEILPTMLINNQFYFLAKVINFTGGIDFLIGASFFVYSYYMQTENKSKHTTNNDNIIFSNHCLLFGIAGLLFETSTLWDASWWWHTLRFSAYLVVLVYFFNLF